MADARETCETLTRNEKFPDGISVPQRSTGSGRGVAFACLRTLGLAAIIAVYVVIGAFVFRAIESQNPPSTLAEILGSHDYEKQIEMQLLQRIWTVTGEMNVLQESVWLNRTQIELSDFMQRHSQRERKRQSQATYFEWTLPLSAFYSYVTITTIGCGPVAPRTALGMATTVMYAIVGTPLLFYYLTSTGRLLADGLRHLVRRCRCFCRKPTTTDADNDSDDGTASWPSLRVFLPVSVLVLFGLHVLVGGFLLMPYGKVGAGGDLATGMYVAFSALLTLDLADGHLVPGAPLWPRDLCSCLLLIGFSAAGMLIISTAVHLVFQQPRRCSCKEHD